MDRVPDNVSRVKGSKKSDSDFYSILRAATYFGYFTGTFLLTLKGRIGTRKYSTSYVAIIYGVIALLLATGQLIMTVHMYIQTGVRFGATVSLKSVIVLDILIIASMVAVFLSRMLEKEKLATVLDDIRNNDEILGRLGIRMDYAAESRRSYVRLGIFISLFLISFNISAYDEGQPSIETLINWLGSVFLYIYELACIYTFVDVIYLLRERFRLLNEYLIKITQEAKESRLETVFSSCGISAKVRSIAVTHRNLCRSAMEVNRIFGVTIVLTVLYHSTSLTVAGYFIYELITHIPVDYFFLISTISFAISSCIPIILLVAISTVAKNQADTTGALIHELSLSESDSQVEDLSVLNDTIQSFSLQLHHEKIEFSGLGLFLLDPTLVSSIAGTVTTYLIILVQFDTDELAKSINGDAANKSLT